MTKTPIVQREDVRVMFRRTTDEQEAITRVWVEVEEIIGSLKGRKFFAAFYEDTKEYRACVQWKEGDDAETLGLEEGTLPGGRYARERLEGEPPGIYELIPSAFERLAQRPYRDPSRPEIEFYRRLDLVDLLEPVV